MHSRLLALDALRGVAAIAVVLRHLPDPTLSHLFPGAYMAVDLFFLLSGFVIAHAYEAKLSAGMTTASFMVQRYVRLTPVYWVGTFLSFILPAYAVATGAWNLEHLIMAAMLVLLFLPMINFPAPWHMSLFPFNVPAWSLFYELVANLMFALLVRRFRKWFPVLVVIGAAGIIWVAVTKFHLDEGMLANQRTAGVARVLFGFFGGVVLYGVWSRMKKAPSLPAPLLMLAFVGVIAIPAIGGQRTIVDCVAVLLVFPAMVFFGAGAQLKKIAGLSLVLGGLSYPLYAVHWPVVQLASQGYSGVTGQAPETAGIALSLVLLAICVGFAIVLDRWFDTPLRAWIKRRATSRAAVVKA